MEEPLKIQKIATDTTVARYDASERFPAIGDLQGIGSKFSRETCSRAQSTLSVEFLCTAATQNVFKKSFVLSLCLLSLQICS